VHRFHRWDISLFKSINNKWRCSFLDRLMPKITHLGGIKISILTCLALLFFSSQSPLGKEAAVALAGSQGIVQLVKKFIPRPRPYLSIPGTQLWHSLTLRDYSFPSGHTTASFSLFTLLSIYCPILAPLFLPLALMVGLSRIYLGLHYPSDVVTGAVLGAISACLVCF